MTAYQLAVVKKVQDVMVYLRRHRQKSINIRARP